MSAASIYIRPSLAVLTDRSGQIAVGGTAQVVTLINRDRRYLLIQNTSAGDLWVNFTATAVVASPSIRIPTGLSLTFENSFVTSEQLSIIGATTAQTFTAKEA